MLAVCPRKIETGVTEQLVISNKMDVWSPLPVTIDREVGFQQKSKMAFSCAWNPWIGLEYPTTFASCKPIFPSSFAMANTDSNPGNWANLHAYSKSELGAEFEVEYIPGYSSCWWHLSLGMRKSVEKFSFPNQ